RDAQRIAAARGTRRYNGQERSEPGCGERALPQRMQDGPAQSVYRAHAEMFVNTPAGINGSCRRHVMNVATEPHLVVCLSTPLARAPGPIPGSRVQDGPDPSLPLGSAIVLR